MVVSLVVVVVEDPVERMHTAGGTINAYALHLLIIDSSLISRLHRHILRPIYDGEKFSRDLSYMIAWEVLNGRSTQSFLSSSVARYEI